MFTGIVEEVGEVVEDGGGVLRVRIVRIGRGTQVGDSIAVDGVDLTVTDMTDTEMLFRVMPETYRCSTLGGFREGRRVNLERSVRSDSRLSGHVVRGVSEGTGTLVSRRDDGDAIVMTYRAPSHLVENIVVRGPVCVDGVSLTVIAKTDTTFSVSVVAFTQKRTTLLDRTIGEAVNLETDIMMRYVMQALQARGIIGSPTR